MHSLDTAAILRRLMTGRGISENELSRVTDVPQPTIHRILNRKSRDPRRSTLKPIADFFGLTLAQLQGDEDLDWEALGLAQVADSGAEDYEPSEEEPGSHVPLLSWLQAARLGERQPPAVPGTPIYPRPQHGGGRTYALRVEGASMEPKFHAGEIIFVDPDRTPDHGSYVVVRQDSDARTAFKQLVVEGGRRYLKALNPRWPEPITALADGAAICGVVIGRYEEF